MKRFLIALAIFMSLGGCFGYLLKNKSSYVLLNYESYAFETSLWFFIILLLVLFVVLNVSINILFKLYRPGKRFSAWAFSRRASAAQKDFYQAILDYELGAWDKALKKFKVSAEYIDRPMVAYLYAARVASKLKRRDLKEELLHEAAKCEPESALALGLVRAELLRDEGNLDEAKAVLTELQAASPSQHQIKTLLETL